MKKFLSALSLLISFFAYSAAPADFDVYLLIGQSNMAGRGELTEKDTTEIIDGVWLLDSAGSPVKATAPLNKYSSIRKALNLQGYNPGVKFAELMHSRTGKNILLVVNAKGGSAISQWMPGDKHKFHDEAIRRTRQAANYGQLKGILWHQGETDIQKHTPDYCGKFKTMIDALRDSLSAPELPVVVGQVGRWGWAPEADIAAFNDSVIPAIPNQVKNCAFVSSINLGRRYKDNERDPHFSRRAQKELGRRYADAITELANEAYTTKFKQGKRSAISFTFDDGDLDHYLLVAPQLEKRNWRGTFWIIGRTTDRGDSVRPRMSWSQLKEMADRGHEISNHSFTHGKLVKMSPEEARRDIEMNDSAIYAHTGRKPLTFCYPFNADPDWLVEIAEAERVGNRTHQKGIGQVNNKMTPEKLKAWVDETIAYGDWGVGMTHGITAGYDKWLNPNQLWEMMDYVKDNEADIWVGRFEDVAQYQKTRDNTVVVKTDTDKQSFQLSTTCSLTPALFSAPVTVAVKGEWTGKTIKAARGNTPIPTTVKGNLLLLEMLPNDTVTVSH